MRDFRDAKSMARTLREELAARHFNISVGESLELVAHLFGVGDWNTLSALIKKPDPDPNQAGARRQGNGIRFALTTETALNAALRAANERGQAESSLEHLLLALTEDPDARAVMKAHGAAPTRIRKLLARSVELASAGDRGDVTDSSPSPAFQRVVQRAILDLRASGGGELTGAHLLVAILSEQGATAVRILREQGLDGSKL